MSADHPQQSAPPIQHWSPNDLICLVALIGGFSLFGLGAWMLFQGIAAEGTVDLKSTVLSGTLKTTSAGLYICFFALFIIIFVLVLQLSPSKSSDAKATPTRSRSSRLMPVFWGLLVALAGSALGVSFAPEGSRTGFSMAVGVLVPTFAAVVFALLRMASDDDA